jgi:hypothetical protein
MKNRVGQTITIVPVELGRVCGSCTVCCTGVLHTEIHGENIYRGKPCRYVDSDGCSIYSDRPPVCISYTCAWLIDRNVPRWLKPSECGVVATWREVAGIRYLDAAEIDRKMDSSVLSWLLMQHVNHRVNIRYQIDGGWNWVGSAEFLQAMAEST